MQDEVEHPEVPLYEFEDLIHRNASEDSSITFMSRGKRFYVDISPKDLHEIEHEYVRLMTALNEEDESDPDLGNPLENFLDWAAEPLLPIFPILAPKLETEKRIVTVAEAYDLPTFFFDLKSVDGVLTAVKKESSGTDSKVLVPSVKIEDRLYSPELLVDPKDLEIAWDPQTEPWPRPSQVSLDGTKYFLKQAIDGTEHCINREIEILLRLQDMETSEIRVPKLHGYVRREESRITGLLLTYIEARGTLGDVVYYDDASEEMKQRWMEQITDTLRALHQAGVTWGDAKADNVLIDTENNAWVIDFGGSFTPGWVDEELKDTVQGDLQGLRKIREHLGLAS